MIKKENLFFTSFSTIVRRLYITEILIIFSLLFLFNNFIKYSDKTIDADGIGYYEYLPSIFIHHDLVRKDIPKNKTPKIYNRINVYGAYIDYGDFKVNKYACGTAILQLPFFTYALKTTKLENSFNDGYQLPFQKAIFNAAIFYLFLSLIFLKKTLSLYNIKNYIIFFCQLLMVLSTSVTYYVNDGAAFSHVYSLFAILAFLYYVKIYFNTKQMKYFVWACVFLGFIILLRQVNIIIILFIPFLAGSFQNLKIGFQTIFQNKKSLIFGLLLFCGILSIQLVIWYLQTGKFFIYSYQGEGFDWLHPQFFNILFSYKKGLFVYTPILFICILSLIWYFYKKNFYSLLSWLFFFIILTYILSSWWSWYYGCSFGLRAYIEFYGVFLIPFAIMLNEVKIILKIPIIVISLVTIPVNIIQTYQYKKYILNWMEMDKEKYWKVFLKTDEKYEGLNWKDQINLKEFKIEKEILLGNIFTKRNTINDNFRINTSTIPNFEKVSILQVLIDSDFQEKDETKIRIFLLNPNTFNYFHAIHLIHFHETKFNEFQTGLFNFRFTPINHSLDKTIAFQIECGKENSYLRNVRLKFLSQ